MRLKPEEILPELAGMLRKVGRPDLVQKGLYVDDEALERSRVMAHGNEQHAIFHALFDKTAKHNRKWHRAAHRRIDWDRVIQVLILLVLLFIATKANAQPSPNGGPGPTSPLQVQLKSAGVTLGTRSTGLLGINCSAATFINNVWTCTAGGPAGPTGATGPTGPAPCTTVNAIFYNSALSTPNCITVVNSSVLVTDSGGAPSEVVRLPATNMPAFTGDVTTVAGAVATTLTNIPSGTVMAGSLLATVISAPGTPAAGKGSVYVDSTSKNLAVKDDAGVIKHGAQSQTCTNQVMTALSDAGALTCTTLTNAYTSGTFAATAHNILSATHGDTTAASAVRGDGFFAIGATPTWQRLAHSGTTGGYFKWNGTDMVASSNAAAGTGSCTNQAVTAENADSAPTCTTITSAYTSGTFTATAHNILSATHGDTTAASAVRGDGMFAIGATPTWQRLAHSATSGGYFKWNGTDIVASSLAAAGTGACTNQAVTAENADAAPTCTTITSAYVDSTITASARNVSTTSPITGGGNLTADRTIACATCVTSAASLTNGQLMAGAGSQASAVTNLTGDVTTSGGVATTLAHTYPLVFGTTTAPACTNGGTTTFVGTSTSSTTETAVIRFIPTEAYTISRIYVNLGGNVPASESVAVAVMDATTATASGVAQTVTCTIGAAAAVCNDTAHSFTTTAGHAINIRVICSGGTTALTAPVHVAIGLK